jgi:hypothetical protein
VYRLGMEAEAVFLRCFSFLRAKDFEEVMISRRIAIWSLYDRQRIKNKVNIYGCLPPLLPSLE